MGGITGRFAWLRPGHAFTTKRTKLDPWMFFPADYADDHGWESFDSDFWLGVLLGQKRIEV
jgi:hypothetical protein